MLWFYVEQDYNATTELEDTRYMISLPRFKNDDKNLNIPEAVKKQVVFNDLYNLDFFRVTKEQWDVLIKRLFESHDLAKKGIEEVTFTYEELFGTISN